MKRVIVLAGAGGSGKSSLARLIRDRCGYVLVDGDMEDTEFFPDGGQWDPANSELLTAAHDKIIGIVRGLLNDGNKIVVDYIIFDRFLEYFEKFEASFAEELRIVVLFPSEKATVFRDLERECWTTGTERIRAVRRKLEAVRGVLGNDKFIDTSGQNIEETFSKYFKC